MVSKGQFVGLDWNRIHVHTANRTICQHERAVADSKSNLKYRIRPSCDNRTKRYKHLAKANKTLKSASEILDFHSPLFPHEIEFDRSVCLGRVPYALISPKV